MSVVKTIRIFPEIAKHASVRGEKTVGTIAVMVIMDTVVVKDATVVIRRYIYAIQRMDVSRVTVNKLNYILMFNAIRISHIFKSFQL